MEALGPETFFRLVEDLRNEVVEQIPRIRSCLWPKLMVESSEPLVDNTTGGSSLESGNSDVESWGSQRMDEVGGENEDGGFALRHSDQESAADSLIDDFLRSDVPEEEVMSSVPMR